MAKQPRRTVIPPDIVPDEAVEILDKLNIIQWDYLLVGDGSGSGWNGPCGWASTMIHRASGDVTRWWGCTNQGSVNLAEAMAYLQPLCALAALRVDAGDTGTRYVHIVTDSKYCAETGDRGHGSLASKNAAIWSAFDVLMRGGLILNWHWVSRMQLSLNVLADSLASKARRLAKGGLSEG